MSLLRARRQSIYVGKQGRNRIPCIPHAFPDPVTPMPDVFLSSRHEDPGVLPIREWIFEQGRRLGLQVWRPPHLPQGMPALDILMDCIRQLDASPLYLCILVDTYGTPQDSLGAVSILELEIVHAILTGKRVRIIALEPFAPEPALASLLAAVERLKPGLVEHATDAQGRRRVRRLLTGHRYFGGWAGLAGKLSQLRKPFAGPWRPNPNDLSLGDAPTFLSGLLPGLPRPTEVHAAVIDGLLAQAAQISNASVRLTVLWAAFRNLSAVPPEEADADGLLLWYRLFSLWADASAWTGRHGAYLSVGRLSVLKTRAGIDALVRSRGHSLPSTARMDVASEMYSLARQVWGRERRAALRLEALALLDETEVESEADATGALLARASLLRVLGKTADAVALHRSVLVRREREHQSPSRIGEAMSELGYVLFQTGQRAEGLSLLVDALPMLASDPGRAPFLVRAQKKLAVCQFRSGRVSLGVRNYGVALDTAVDARLYGQVRQVDRVIWWLWRVAGAPRPGWAPQGPQHGASGAARPRFRG